MGTRSLTKIYNENVKLIVTMYRQMDGYPSGHGLELTDFLNEITIVNGLSSGQPKRIANGMGCLAAQAVAHFKEGPGGIYLVTPGDHDQEFVYEVTETNIVIRAPRRVIFAGTWREGYDFCKKYRD